MQEETLVYRYSNMLYKICLVILCNEHDAQDAVQETFYRYLRKRKDFQNNEHEKAWLIRVATNICKDMRRFQLRHPMVAIEQTSEAITTFERSAVLEELMMLPDKLKVVVYLYYIEGYSQREIGEMLHISEAAVKKRMQRGKEQFRINIQGEVAKGEHI